jgi:hypothetical protein
MQITAKTNNLSGRRKSRGVWVPAFAGTTSASMQGARVIGSDQSMRAAAIPNKKPGDALRRPVRAIPSSA